MYRTQRHNLFLMIFKYCTDTPFFLSISRFADCIMLHHVITKTRQWKDNLDHNRAYAILPVECTICNLAYCREN